MTRFTAWSCPPVLVMMLLCGVATSIRADVNAALAEARSLAREGNFAPAWCIWRRLADEGDAEAQFNLGWLYHNGQGVVIDDQQARAMWEKAAQQGHGEAQMALAMLYSQGGAVGIDQAQAVKWYHAAARQGFEDALLILLDYAQEGDPAAANAVAELVREGSAGTPVRVVDKANVRDRPSTKGGILVTLPGNARVMKLDTRGKWRRVWVPDIKGVGWMHQSVFR